MWSPCLLLATRAASCLETAYVVKDRTEVAGQQQDGEFLLLAKCVEGKKAWLGKHLVKGTGIYFNTSIFCHHLGHNNNQIRWNMFCGKVSKIGHVTWGHLIYEMLGRPSFWAYLEDTAGIRNAIAALSNESSQKCTLVDQFHFNTWCDDFSACHHRQRSAGAFLYGRHSERLHSSRLGAMPEPKVYAIDSAKYVWVNNGQHMNYLGFTWNYL